MNWSVWRGVRFSLYIAFIINGIIVQWFLPFRYKCNLTDEQCFACGLRTSVNLLLQGRFSEAYQSNKLIVLLVVCGILMVIDIVHYIYQYRKEKK